MAVKVTVVPVAEAEATPGFEDSATKASTSPFGSLKQAVTLPVSPTAIVCWGIAPQDTGGWGFSQAARASSTTVAAIALLWEPLQSLTMLHYAAGSLEECVIVVLSPVVNRAIAMSLEIARQPPPHLNTGATAEFGRHGDGPPPRDAADPSGCAVVEHRRLVDRNPADDRGAFRTLQHDAFQRVVRRVERQCEQEDFSAVIGRVRRKVEREQRA